jgi:hypothetical protein
MDDQTFVGQEFHSSIFLLHGILYIRLGGLTAGVTRGAVGCTSQIPRGRAVLGSFSIITCQSWFLEIQFRPLSLRDSDRLGLKQDIVLNPLSPTRTLQDHCTRELYNTKAICFLPTILTLCCTPLWRLCID